MEQKKSFRLNIGPVHPATHGVFKIVVDIDGDTIKRAQTEIGFLHRAKEKIAEARYFSNYYPIVDKLDYVSAINMEVLYASLVEKAADIKIPPRAAYIRTIMCEIQRIMSHLIFMGSFGEDVGNITSLVWTLRERELLMNVIEKISGGRLAPMYMTNGGSFYDFPDGISEDITRAIDKIEERINHEYQSFFLKNELFLKRTKGVAIIDQEMVKRLGITGPGMRAAGIKRDLRKDEPYLCYDKVDFDVPVSKDGDAYARFMMRVEEILQSIKIIRQALKDLPAGDYRIKTPWMMKILPKYTFVRQETPRGEMAMYMVTNGDTKPYRLKIRSATFFNIRALEEVLVGEKVADAVVTIASLDPVMGEVDR